LKGRVGRKEAYMTPTDARDGPGKVDRGMTYEEFAVRYGLSKRKVQRLVARGDLRVMRDGRTVRVLESDALAWAASRRTSS
jgi:excisionase family DNA binding protein